MKRDIPPYWPLMSAYHQARAPLFEALLCDAALPPKGRILDAGCGDAYYSQVLAAHLGPGAQIIAADHNLSLLNFLPDLPSSVSRLAGDLEHLPIAPASLDAVWLCRTMHSAFDPVGFLMALARLLRPGGRLIVIENHTAHSPIFPLPPGFERRLREARFQYEHSECRAGGRPERFAAGSFLPLWLTQAGLERVSAHTYVSEDLSPLAEPIARYWQEMLAWEATRVWSFLSPSDQATYTRLLQPDSPDYLLAQPGAYCLELTTMASATRP